MEISTPVLTHEDVVRSRLVQRGAYRDLGYTPIFRSSALFFVWVDGEIDTTISFMNYWREKNRNDRVTALVTLRAADGRKIFRDCFPIEQWIVQLEVKDMLGSQGHGSFTGSLEVELFSTQDLKFPYPAITAFYCSADGVSFVHANQRVFNNFEDMDRLSPLNAWQSGFDVAIDDRYTSYLTLVNGPRAVPEAKAVLKLYNAMGEVKDAVVSLGALEPYGSRLIWLDQVPWSKAFFGGKTGFCKANLDAFGVFLRVACGIASRDRSQIEVTHSYYDTSHHNDYYETRAARQTDYTCFLPFGLLPGLELELVFYPIYARSQMRFSLDCFTPEGRLRAQIERFATFDAQGTHMLRIDVRRLLREHDVSIDEDTLYCLHLDDDTGRIPARVAVGINYRRGELGCNINAQMMTAASYGLRKRLYRWGPLMWADGSENWILVSHLNKTKGVSEDGTLKLTLFGKSGPIARETYQTRQGTTLNIRLHELLAQTAYRPSQEEVLWYTAESSCPNYVIEQIHLSRSGFVGGDHSF